MSRIYTMKVTEISQNSKSSGIEEQENFSIYTKSPNQNTRLIEEQEKNLEFYN